jgi:RNA polymerase sigma-70 factor (ECF subfamily)
VQKTPQTNVCHAQSHGIAFLIVNDLHPETGDVDLIQRMGTGDTEAFTLFQRRHIGIIYSTAHRVLNNDTDAEDVTQEVLFMLWEKSPMYDIERGKPVTWIVTMTRNKAIDRLRSLQRRLRLQDEVRLENPESVDTRTPAQSLRATEKNELVRTAVMKLNPDQREVIEMLYFSGLSQQEISDRIHKPISTVKARIHRGMVRLRKIVGTEI